MRKDLCALVLGVNGRKKMSNKDIRFVFEYGKVKHTYYDCLPIGYYFIFKTKMLNGLTRNLLCMKVGEEDCYSFSTNYVLTIDKYEIVTPVCFDIKVNNEHFYTDVSSKILAEDLKFGDIFCDCTGKMYALYSDGMFIQGSLPCISLCRNPISKRGQLCQFSKEETVWRICSFEDLFNSRGIDDE